MKWALFALATMAVAYGFTHRKTPSSRALPAVAVPSTRLPPRIGEWRDSPNAAERLAASGIGSEEVEAGSATPLTDMKEFMRGA